MKKIKLLALFGPSAAGKDFLMNYVLQKNTKLTRVVSYTTRQPRDGEEDGIHYHFIDNAEFAQRVLNGDIVEATTWGGEFYGSSISAMDPDKINIAVLDPTGIDCLISDPRFDVIPIFIIANDKTRLLRALNRESSPDCDKIIQRYMEDKKTFNEDFDFEFYSYYNGDNTDPLWFMVWLIDRGFLSKSD